MGQDGTRVPSGELEVDVPPRKGQPARRARLSVRQGTVTLKPPKGKGYLGPIRLWAVYVTETGYGSEMKVPLEWLLLTDVETVTFGDACCRICWYGCRWGVEVFHRTVKNYCRILDRRLETPDRLETCLALDLIVGWRIFWALRLARTAPSLPCDAFLDAYEWQGLWAYFNRGKQLPAAPPSCMAAATMIAKLGGFLGRKIDGHRGAVQMARGIQRLHDIVWMFEAVRRHSS